jgi:hypothetical protein
VTELKVGTDVSVHAWPVETLEKALFHFVDAIMTDWQSKFPWGSERASGTSNAGRKMTTRLGSNCHLMRRQMMSSSIKQSFAKCFMSDWHLVL